MTNVIGAGHVQYNSNTLVFVDVEKSFIQFVILFTKGKNLNI